MLFSRPVCLQCFDTVGSSAGRASGLHKKNEWWCAGVVICLERGADLHIKVSLSYLRYDILVMELRWNSSSTLSLCSSTLLTYFPALLMPENASNRSVSVTRTMSAALLSLAGMRSREYSSSVHSQSCNSAADTWTCCTNISTVTYPHVYQTIH